MHTTRFICWSLLIAVLLCSCEVAVFDSFPPAKKELKAFPSSFEGEWIASTENDNFYVNRFSCNDDTIFYEMESIAPGVMSPLVLEKDSLELHAQKGSYYLSIAGPGYWLHYLLKQPSKNELVVYGFSEETKRYVKQYESDNTEDGFKYTVFHPTKKEWKQLLKSSALTELRRFRKKEL